MSIILIVFLLDKILRKVFDTFFTDSNAIQKRHTQNRDSIPISTSYLDFTGVS